MSLTDFAWLLLIFAGIAVALWALFTETVNAWYEWRYERENEQ